MSITINIDEAQQRLPELIDSLGPGDEVVIMRDQRTIAKLIGQNEPQLEPPQPGNCQGLITLLIEDDEHLQDFKDYMP
ncbi:MAG: hypothetical protein SFX18_00695 [Pirellulales bacterium]|nr:hypothetical protein [Pirellulales bacterium]